MDNFQGQCLIHESDTAGRIGKMLAYSCVLIVKDLQ